MKLNDLVCDKRFEYREELGMKLNEMVGVKVAWYWHELKFHNYVLVEMDGYGTTGKEMKKGELSRDGM